MPYIISPNMSLQIPSVGTQPGPDYALNINTSLSLVDAHDHSPGNGVQITPDGLDINDDLSFNENNAISLRTARFEAQNAVLTDPADIGCLYVVADDLYYNDGNGNDIRITQSGQVVSGSGNIAGLAPPASAVYTSGNGTFTWQQDVNTPANMDSGPVTVREPVVGGFGVTIQPDVSIAANYTLTLPAAPPASLRPVLMSNTGNLSTSLDLSLDSLDVVNDVTITTGGLIIDQGGVQVTLGNVIASTGLIAAEGNLISNTQVFPTTTSRASLVSTGTKVVGVKQNGGSDLPIVVSATNDPNNSTMVIWGGIDATGVITKGMGGWSVTVNSTGNYTINFSSSFSGAPAIVVTPANAAAGTTVSINSTSTAAANILTYDSTGTLANRGFHFIATGIR